MAGGWREFPIFAIGTRCRLLLSLFLEGGEGWKKCRLDTRAFFADVLRI